MTSVLIVLALLALAVGIVVFATRRRPDAVMRDPIDHDVTWNDPVTLSAPEASADPFAHAPPPPQDTRS